MWNVPKERVLHFGAWQALIMEVTVWTFRRITVIVLLKTKKRVGLRDEPLSIKSLRHFHDAQRNNNISFKSLFLAEWEMISSMCLCNEMYSTSSYHFHRFIDGIGHRC